MQLTRYYTYSFLASFSLFSLLIYIPYNISHLSSLVQRKEEWAIAFRAGAMLRGHHTNSFCETTICIIKDVVLNRYGFN